MTLDIAIVLIILGVSLVLFISEVIRMDLVALLVLGALALTGLVNADQAFAGFSNGAVITVWAMFILSEGLTRTGIADVIGRQVMRLGGRQEVTMILVIMITGAVLSAFMNNIGVAALMLPVVVDVARRTRIPASRLLMPLAYSTLLGGLMTLIGAGGPVIFTPDRGGMADWGGQLTGFHRVDGDIEKVLVDLGFSYTRPDERSSLTTTFGLLGVATLLLIAAQWVRRRPIRKLIATSVAVIALTLVPLTALAGGWGIVSIDSLPADFEAGHTYELEYTYLAHGETAFDAGPTEVVFRSDEGKVLRFEADKTGVGRYAVDVHLEEGTWRWGINHTGGSELQAMGVIEVGADSAVATAGDDESPWRHLLPIAAVAAGVMALVELSTSRRNPPLPTPV